MGTIREPRNESSKATLARIKKEMAQPHRQVCEKGGMNQTDSQ